MDFISAIRRLQRWWYPVEKIEIEILNVSKTINALSPDRGVNIEGTVYQYFPSKADALDFAKKWTRGSNDSFTVEQIDVDRLDIKFYSPSCNISVFRKDHPNFDPKDRGGILYQTPALFFGMETASNEQGEDYYDLWFYEFCRLKLSWLKEYRDHLINEKRSLAGNNKVT
jgi:hypothetical protein